MNSVIAEIAGLLNGLLAIALVCGGGVLGYNAPHLSPFGLTPPEFVSALTGTLAGTVVAVIVCGLLAVLLDIRRTLLRIRADLQQGSLSGIVERREPSISR